MIQTSNLCFGKELPANTLEELNARFHSCLKISNNQQEVDMTVTFMITRDGNLLGKPRISIPKKYFSSTKLIQFSKSVLVAMKDCFPLEITDALGNTLAGKPLQFRITKKTHQIDV